jgi:acyl carrier protein
MNLDSFIKNIARQIDKDPSKLSGDTILTDIDGWSSLEALFVLLMVDELYKVNVSGDDLRKLETIEDLYNFIKSKM